MLEDVPVAMMLWSFLFFTGAGFGLGLVVGLRRARRPSPLPVSEPKEIYGLLDFDEVDTYEALVKRVEEWPAGMVSPRAAGAFLKKVRAKSQVLRPEGVRWRSRADVIRAEMLRL